MIKIGITGSLASGKSTASKILSYKRGPLFSADKAVKELYKNRKFKSLLIKKFKIINKHKIKKFIKKNILNDYKNIQKLEKIIHPLVRKKMHKFSKLHQSKKIVFYEIPLLIESKLMKHFNVIIFIKANKKLRLKRFKARKGNTKLFELLNSRQMLDKKKIDHCDFVVVNEKNLNFLKRKLIAIINKYD
tara:strand:+ start:1759 stop:2325 length:567 start_codon:yes stop_codon:yes gene_type:complete